VLLGAPDARRCSFWCRPQILMPICCAGLSTLGWGRRWRAPAGGSYIVLLLTVVYSYRERATTGGSPVSQRHCPCRRCHLRHLPLPSGQTQSSCAQLQTRGSGSPLSAARLAPRYVPDGIGPGDGRSKWCIPGERRPKATRKIRVAFLRSILNDFLNEWLSKSGSFA
jgi:hypothetical protein